MGLKHHPRVVTNGLVYYLDAANPRCYSGSGITSNALVGGIGATLINGVGFTTSNSGSFVFDGTNDFINIPGIEINTSFTIGMYFLSLSDNRTNIITGKYAGGTTDFWIGTTNSGGPYKAWFSITDGANPNKLETKSYNLTTGVWYYITAVYNNNNNSTYTASLYMNGVLQQSLTGGLGFSNPTGNYTIGNYSIGTPVSAYFQGNLGSHHYYNRALTQQEILQNYNATKMRYGL
jgi:hypothetical protein